MHLAYPASSALHAPHGATCRFRSIGKHIRRRACSWAVHLQSPGPVDRTADAWPDAHRRAPRVQVLVPELGSSLLHAPLPATAQLASTTSEVACCTLAVACWALSAMVCRACLADSAGAAPCRPLAVTCKHRTFTRAGLHVHHGQSTGPAHAWRGAWVAQPLSESVRVRVRSSD